MFKKSNHPRAHLNRLDIPVKANRILHCILIALIFIIIRIWHLTIIEYDDKLEKSRKPQLKTIIEPAIRASIRDRFNLPLAINKVAYQATILYSPIKDIPAFEWELNQYGKRVKVSKRKPYIRQLAEVMGQKLKLDPDHIEDLIYSKASYYSKVPYVIKDELTEQEFYQLKVMEKEWPGIHIRHVPKRYYPHGRVAGDVLGYMGAINRFEYEKILHEMKALEQIIQEGEDDRGSHLMPEIQTIAQAENRLKILEAKAYGLNDFVGKSGIENKFEETLRGFYGKTIYYSDSRGNYLREMPESRPSITGRRVLLTISAELQEYAERLLAQNEDVRIVRRSPLAQIKRTIIANKHPWIKGGSIIAMDPKNGEILAMASYPRYNPNDFISSANPEIKKKKQLKIQRWLETEGYIRQVWNQQVPLERERFDFSKQQFYDEEKNLTWDSYLTAILLEDSPLYKSIKSISTLKHAIDLQWTVDHLLSLFPNYDLHTLLHFIYVDDGHEPFKIKLKNNEKQILLNEIKDKQPLLDSIKKNLDPYFASLSQNYDKVLLIDLCKLAVPHDRFSEELEHLTENIKIDPYFALRGYLVALKSFLKERFFHYFHQVTFKQWRIENEKNFLKSKRQDEKANKFYPKPYLDYLEHEENEQFQLFWNTHQWDILLAFLQNKEEESTLPNALYPFLPSLKELIDEIVGGENNEINKSYGILKDVIKDFNPFQGIEFLQTIREYSDLERPLYGKYRSLRGGNDQTEKSLAAAFYPKNGFGYGRSHAYRQSTIQGSLFKIVTGYAALMQKFKELNPQLATMQDLNPLTMVDQVFYKNNQCHVGYTDEGKPIPQQYKGGRLPRSLAHQHNGKVDFIRALEVSSNPYFSILAGEYLNDPHDLADAARLFSYGERTGIQLPGEIKGFVPNDLNTNRTGLYAMAIGQHTLVVTPLQTAVMLSTLANGGKVLHPKIVRLTAGREHENKNDPFSHVQTFPLQDSLLIAGINFPLFSSLLDQNEGTSVKLTPTKTIRELHFPTIVRKTLLKGLKATVDRTYQDNLKSLTQLYRQHPEAIRQFSLIKDQLYGKTSTSEVVENLDLDLKDGTSIYTHVWFGGISSVKDKTDETAIMIKDEFGQPELVIVVYLRYGGYGKEAAPIAAQIIHKWRELKQKYQGD